ncbi:MAG TPA: hypothetical protein VLW25_08220 [Bryobacteraceae bacterium]|nr:hypothetical protein [Bryobacteraceae bacterium]
MKSLILSRAIKEYIHTGCSPGAYDEQEDFVRITLPLKPQEEAKLVALAQAKGLSADALVRVALDKFLAESSGEISLNQPTRSLRGLLAKYGPAPSVEEIDQNRAEMFVNFPGSDD